MKPVVHQRGDVRITGWQGILTTGLRYRPCWRTIAGNEEILAGLTARVLGGNA
jgi:hypothetical protein